MKLPPSLEAFVNAGGIITLRDLVARIAHEACRLQRDADNEHRVAGRAGQAPLVVPSTED